MLIMLYEIMVHLSSMWPTTSLVTKGALGTAVPPLPTGIGLAKLTLNVRVVELIVPNCQSPQTIPLYPLVVRKVVSPSTPSKYEPRPSLWMSVIVPDGSVLRSAAVIDRLLSCRPFANAAATKPMNKKMRSFIFLSLSCGLRGDRNDLYRT